MRLFLIVIVFLKLIIPDFCLKPSDFCMISEKKCKSLHDLITNEYKLHCEEVKCQGKLNYQCDMDHCTISKEICDEFLKLKTTRNTLLIEDFERPNRRYQMYIRVVRKCTPQLLGEHENDWNSSDVCINGEECFYRKIIPMRSRTSVKVMKRVECPCIGNYSYFCGKDFCSLNRHACEGLNVRFFTKTKAQELGIKQCENSKIIV